MKKKITFILLSIVLVLVIIGSSTYSLLFKVSETENQSYTTGTLLVTSNTTNDSVTLTNSLPMEDSAGASSTAYTFKITNTGNLTYNFDVMFLSTTTSNQVDSQYIKLKVNDGSVTSLSALTDGKILENQTLEPGDSLEVTLRVWLDINTPNTEIGKVFNAKVTTEGKAVYTVQKVDTSGANAPKLTDGLIPVYYDESINKWVKADSSNADNLWYNYSEKRWANAVLVTEANRSTYTSATAGTEIAESDILAYYVWIPRYKYKVLTSGTATGDTMEPQTIDIVFEQTPIATSDKVNDSMATGTLVGSYRTHPAFWWDNDSDGVVDTGEIIAGIWVGKFEISSDTPTASNGGGNSTTYTVRVLPNVPSWRSNTVGNFYTVIKNMQASENIYGLSTATSSVDSHMLKNSEWGAVAYLSHSQYGANREIYINNSSGYYTGRSGGNIGGSTAINSVYTSQTSTAQYNAYGFYTWDGYLLEYNTDTKSSTRNLTKIASTTGNISGVYDMSGGSHEYVMGYYEAAESSSWGAAYDADYAGFSSEPASKYYDNYTSRDRLTACNDGICYGHALSETNNWYSDYDYFISGASPWFARGGYHNSGTNAGVFYFNGYTGIADSNFSARSALVVR